MVAGCVKIVLPAHRTGKRNPCARQNRKKKVRNAQDERERGRETETRGAHSDGDKYRCVVSGATIVQGNEEQRAERATDLQVLLGEDLVEQGVVVLHGPRRLNRAVEEAGLRDEQRRKRG